MTPTSTRAGVGDAKTNGHDYVPIKFYLHKFANLWSKWEGLLVLTGMWVPMTANPWEGDRPPHTPHHLPLFSQLRVSALQASPTDVRGYSALLFRNDGGNSMSQHSALLEKELLRMPCPQEWEARAWGLQRFLKIQRSGVVACIPAQRPSLGHIWLSPLPTCGLSPLWQVRGNRVQKKEGMMEGREPLSQLWQLPQWNLPHMTDAYGFRQWNGSSPSILSWGHYPSILQKNIEASFFCCLHMRSSQLKRIGNIPLHFFSKQSLIASHPKKKNKSQYCNFKNKTTLKQR